jgi:hypothetical protein
MTTTELEKVIKDRLGAAGLSDSLDERQDQYLEFPDGFFAEVVLRDGSKLADAQRILKGVKEELGKRGTELSGLVRAIWEVVSVRMAPLESGTSSRFIVNLRSGSRECTVTVNVTGPAFASILAAFRAGSLGEYGTDHNAALAGIVTEFVRLELSYGGESSWDPILRPELELNDSALQYLMIHSPTKAS